MVKSNFSYLYFVTQSCEAASKVVFLKKPHYEYFRKTLPFFDHIIG